HPEVLFIVKQGLRRKQVKKQHVLAQTVSLPRPNDEHYLHLHRRLDGAYKTTTDASYEGDE
ncbi:hypothetical protein JMJ77_0000209, partial [Colletotrichum scovillei]